MPGGHSSWACPAAPADEDRNREVELALPYGTEGTYPVSLIVTDDEGSPSSSVSKPLTVRLPGSNVDPVADFTSARTNLTCNFTDQSTRRNTRNPAVLGSTTVCLPERSITLSKTTLASPRMEPYFRNAPPLRISADA